MSANSVPSQVILVPVQAGATQKLASKHKKENKNKEQSTDRFVIRTLLAAKAGKIAGGL